MPQLVNKCNTFGLEPYKCVSLFILLFMHRWTEIVVFFKYFGLYWIWYFV
jgi:hypothetical protein